MHGLNTIYRMNRETPPPGETVEGKRDFLIGHHVGSDISIITPLSTKAVQWAYTNIREHLGREGIAYVVHAEAGALLESQIRNNGFGVN